MVKILTKIYLYLSKPVIFLCIKIGMILFNIYILFRKFNDTKKQKNEVEAINDYTKAVETVDNMDDDAIVDVLSGLQSKKNK